MAKKLICDVCKQPTERIAFKIFISPVVKGKSRATHSNYTGHADVGECCATKIYSIVNWQKRVIKANG